MKPQDASDWFSMPEDRPLTIVHVLRAPMGGVLRHVHDLATSHTETGCRVGIICDIAGRPGYNESVLAALNSTTHFGVQRVAMSRKVGPKDIVSARQIDSMIDRIAPDIIHGHGAKGGLFARLARGGAHKPARFYSPHGGSLHFDPETLAGKIYFTVEKKLESRTDAILFVADFERRTYRKKIGELICPSVIIYNGLDTHEFEPVVPGNDARDFLFIGDMRMLKGPDLLIDALAQINAGRDRPATALMVGAGADEDEIRQRIIEQGLEAQVQMAPPMPARQAFARGHTVVIPSRAEAMPYIVLEALAAQRPVIATSVGGIPEIYGSNADALVAPLVPQLAAAMEKALDNPAAFAASMPPFSSLKERFAKASMTSNVLDAYKAARR